jgi:hypothetical protein
MSVLGTGANQMRITRHRYKVKPEYVGCRPESGWNSVWRIPGDMKLSFQAARSIG